MRTLLANSLTWLAHKIAVKAGPGPATASSGGSFVDLYKRTREPSTRDLLGELKNTAWACASVNAAVCATYYPRLFVRTGKSQPEPKCLTAPLHPKGESYLRERYCITKALRLEEVLEHPLLTLFRRVFDVPPGMNQFDLWELTTLYQEVFGTSFWKIDYGAFGEPAQVWILPSQYVRPVRQPGSRQLVDYYETCQDRKPERYDPADIIHFRYPHPGDPYCSGWSPLRACYEQIRLTSHYTARREALMQNEAIPAAIISPDEVIGEEERDRLEEQWNQKFRRGGAGRVIVADSKMKVDLLSHSMGDLATLAENGATKEDICNAFHVPMSFMTRDTNMANIKAGKQQHMELAISPRLRRRDEKLNEQLVPLFDPSGRLFVASDDPIPANTEEDLKRQDQDLRHGIQTINEVRAERGLAPVPWGNTPWLPVQLAQTDLDFRAEIAPNSGRTRTRRRDTDADGVPDTEE